MVERMKKGMAANATRTLARMFGMSMSVSMIALFLASGCATPKGSEATNTEPEEEEQVMYSPPEDAERPIEVPRGGPILDEYEKPTSSVTPEPPVGSAANATAGTIQKQTLEAILAQGPGWGLSQVQVKPARDGGAFIGFEITSFSPQAAATISPPLQVGDVITHLNGVRLEQPDDYMEAFNLSRTVTEVRVDYIRAQTASFSTWQVIE